MLIADSEVPDLSASARRPGIIKRLAGAAVEADDSDVVRLRKTLLLLASGLMNTAAVAWVAIYWSMGLRLPTTIPFAFQVLSALIVLIYLRTRNFDFFRVAQLSLFLFFPFVVQWAIGSFVSSSGIALLALLAPIGAMICYGPRESIPWFVAFLVLTAVSGVFDFYLGKGETYGIPMKTIAVFFVLNFTIISTIVWLLLRYFVQKRDAYESELATQHALVRIERERSDRVLGSVLPQHVAERLKKNPGSIADGYADVSVMFADLVNFTGLAEQLAPDQVVKFLDDVFSRFDDMVYMHRLDKIKTIGDAYMVAGGLAGDRVNYVERVADLALAMIDSCRTDPALRRYGVQMHVGIATGPAVAGVIGSTRIAYDLWGDTVNVANRLTTEAAAGAVLVDKTTYRRLSNGYRFEEAREVQVKGKGTISVHRLIDKAASVR